MREGDIEALRNKMELEGRPIKSTVIRDGDRQIFYEVNKGKVKVTDEIRTER